MNIPESLTECKTLNIESNKQGNSALEKPMPEAEKKDAGKVEPQAIPYELAERMAIMGENCEPEQIKPYVTDSGILVIPFASSQKYHYWKQGGQSVCDTLRELGRCDLIPKYKSNLSRN